ncbi:MAG: hypothetical protein ABIR37_01545 [Candidatus Saccharimonadales bacterium]
MNLPQPKHEITTYNDPQIQREYGDKILNDLIWAVEKKIPLERHENDLRAASRRVSKAAKISEPLVRSWLSSNNERSYWYEKFAHRKSRADLYIASDIGLEVEGEDGSVLAAGTLEYVDYQNAMMALETPHGESTYLPFAKEKDIPEGLLQSYYGHTATVILRVMSAPVEHYWKFTDDTLI